MSTNKAGGDSDVAVDADGVVYASDLQDGTVFEPLGPKVLEAPMPSSTTAVPVSVSFDHGRSFRYSTAVPEVNAVDRQWTLAWGHGHVIDIARVTEPAGPTLEAWLSDDRAHTFNGPVVIAQPAVVGGHPVRAGGAIYVPYVDGSGVLIAASRDGGRSWRRSRIASTQFVATIPSVGVDDSGTIYVAWASGRGVGSNFSYGSVDLHAEIDVADFPDGIHWSAPVTISDPGQSSVFPWLVAGASGRVDIVWFQSHAFAGADTGPDIGSPRTTWDVEIGQSLDGNAPLAHWERGVAVPSVHTGAICTQGGGCAWTNAVNAPLPMDRSFLDFFVSTARPDGSLQFVYPMDRNPTATKDPKDAYAYNVDIREAVQTAGTRLR